MHDNRVQVTSFDAAPAIRGRRGEITGSRRLLPLVFLALGASCGFGTDAATRIAYGIEAGAGRLGGENGARYRIRHDTPSRSGECEGPYTVQLDKVGALIVWCRDDSGHTVSSHSTSYHGRFVDTSRTFILEKEARSPLIIDLQRQGRRAVIVDAG